jgi:hypothetical protein
MTILMGDKVEPRRDFHREEREAGGRPAMLTAKAANTNKTPA